MKKLLAGAFRVMPVPAALVFALRAHEYYAEPGGKDISISVAEPVPKGLDNADNYLLTRIKTHLSVIWAGLPE